MDAYFLLDSEQKNFRLAAKNFCRDCQNCSLGVDRNNLRFRKRELVDSQLACHGEKNQPSERMIFFS